MRTGQCPRAPSQADVQLAGQCCGLYGGSISGSTFTTATYTHSQDRSGQWVKKQVGCQTKPGMDSLDIIACTLEALCCTSGFVSWNYGMSDNVSVLCRAECRLPCCCAQVSPQFIFSAKLRGQGSVAKQVYSPGGDCWAPVPSVRPPRPVSCRPAFLHNDREHARYCCTMVFQIQACR